MTDLIDMNRDENGKSQIQFSREPISTALANTALEYSTEQFARRELEKLKLRALAHAFGLDDEPNMWFYLSLKLAQLHYPEPKSVGRKMKWTKQNRILLRKSVDQIVIPTDPSHGVNYACKILANKEPWLLLLGGIPNQSEALRVQYYKALDSNER
ncbi:hypothetical protein MCEMIEM12_01652 [Burkholderiaceae bacterium]|jgi:hypothetical protein